MIQIKISKVKVQEIDIKLLIKLVIYLLMVNSYNNWLKMKNLHLI